MRTLVTEHKRNMVLEYLKREGIQLNKLQEGVMRIMLMDVSHAVENQMLEYQRTGKSIWYENGMEVTK